MAALSSETPASLHIGKCGLCHEYRVPEEEAKCLVDKHGVPVCHCKFCSSLGCRKLLEVRKSGTVSSGEGCPVCREKVGQSEFKSFVRLGTVVLPKDNPKDFFKSINLSRSGSVTQDEVAGFISGYFEVEHAVAMSIVEKHWESWDTNQRGLLRRGFGILSATDGKLDEEEFEAVRSYLAALIENVKVPVRMVAGLKRSRGDDDPAYQSHIRRVRQRTDDAMRSSLLISLLKSDDGRKWFEKCDKDRSGNLSSNELIDALAETFSGKLPKCDAKSVVEGLWQCIDVDNSDEVDFQEFTTFREVLLRNIEVFGE